MSSPSSNSADKKLVLLRDLWVDCLSRVLGQVAGFAVSVQPETESPGVPSGGQAEVWAVFALAKALRGEMAVLSTEAGAVQLAQVLMAEPPDATVPFDAGRRDAFDEIMRQVAGLIATGLKSPAEGEVEIKLSSASAPLWKDAARTPIRISGEKFTPFQLILTASPELVNSFPASGTEAPPPAAAIEKPSAQPELSTAQNANLELVLDVSLDATICFGRREMLLREVLELHPGAAVSLDRHVEEPVELLVGGRVVARGEVVIVDGNYGLRVTEIMSTQQRIASLQK